MSSTHLPTASPQPATECVVTPGSLKETRRDGHILSESTTIEQMVELGWAPDKIIALQWECCGKLVQMTSTWGLLPHILPNRQYVAVVDKTDSTGDHGVLSLYQADGSLVRSFSNRMDVGGLQQEGEFLWFEQPSSSSGTAFAPVFCVARSGDTFQVDMDATSAAVLGMRPIR